MAKTLLNFKSNLRFLQQGNTDQISEATIIKGLQEKNSSLRNLIVVIACILAFLILLILLYLFQREIRIVYKRMFKSTK